MFNQNSVVRHPLQERLMSAPAVRDLVLIVGTGPVLAFFVSTLE
jgi:hypothetical protein